MNWFTLLQMVSAGITRVVRRAYPSWVAIPAVLLMVSEAAGQPGAAPPRQFLPGVTRRIEDLPPGRFRLQLEQLPPQARERALQWLGTFHHTEADAGSLHADADGGIFYADFFSLAPPSPGAPVPDPPVAEAAVPVSPFPASLVFHSRSGAPNVLFLNFAGEDVSNTAWNNSLGRTLIPAVAFSSDSDYATFSDAEQLAIKRIWQRVAEDYAPFDIDVTTERPAAFGTRTAHALITRNTDANGQPNPSSSAGGVAYISVFASSSYATYRPAWIYYNNLAYDESYIAEAASHEIGHNLGLSHDGKTDGTEYYSGHGTGDISWGPLMGTGYDRNVSQWCKGDYYLANNTQDDLATIAAKLAYRPDDHGNTSATATFLTITAGTNIVSTTPETDPANNNPANKGVLERTTDVDVFAFVTGSGAISLAVDPWITPGGRTRGGNVDILLELRSDAGVLVATNNPPAQTTARIDATVAEGLYYLFVRNTGTGDPMSSTPSGYTSYGSLGQYFLSGHVLPSGFVIPPQAELQITDVTQAGAGPLQFTVRYSDNLAVDTSTIGSGDVRITGPNGYDRTARFVSLDLTANGTPRVATYAADPPAGGSWTANDDGAYLVWMEPTQVRDTEGAWVAARQLGQFLVSLPRVVYSATMEVDPGWTLEPLWQYGTPAYAPGTGPAAGFTGTKIMAYNLSGSYQDGLTNASYATTPAIDCAGTGSLTLHFRRWLRLKRSDTALIQVSTNGVAWTDLWRTTRSVSDSAWQDLQYALPSWAAGSHAVQVRWGLGSNNSQTDIGWNLDDVEILAGGTLDTTPPAATLSASDITIGGSPVYSFSVSYTDNTAVKVASLGASNLVVTGPNGYTNLADFVGVDSPTDGTPRTATYSIPAPGGIWDAADNGAYQVALQAGEVLDVYNNATGETLLGGFTASIPTGTTTYQLAVTGSPAGWGTVAPTGGVYASGSSVPLTATPLTYYKFVQWSGDASGTGNPITVLVNQNLAIQAVFGEIVTTNYGTPHWWLASFGYTNNFETAAASVGANGMLVWQSYIAGLNPTNPTSQVLLRGEIIPVPPQVVLQWSTVTGRVYTVFRATNAVGNFTPVPGASNLSWTITGYTNAGDAASAPVFYRLGVQKP